MTTPDQPTGMNELREALDNLYLDAWNAGRIAERQQSGIRTVTPNFKEAEAAKQIVEREVLKAKIKQFEMFLLAFSGDMSFEAVDSMRFQIAEFRHNLQQAGLLRGEEG